jgi:serine/threonine protein kinase
MSIERDHIIKLSGKLYLVRCNEREGRFGLDEQPKFWVKRAIALDTGRTHILKLVFHEEFKCHIGHLSVKCRRSEEKEGRVLELVRGDERFMQGRTERDVGGNLVRVIDYIKGMDLFSYFRSLTVSHREYMEKLFPEILAKTMECLGAIQFLHEAGLCHGDIRNDHIIIEEGTGRFRWIDFDLTQDFPDFYVWSTGNILQCIVGKGSVRFTDIRDVHPELESQLTEDDASAFFPHRIMNLRKVYPYVPEKLNDILMRFSAGAGTYYDRVDQILFDLSDCASAMGWPIASQMMD